VFVFQPDLCLSFAPIERKSEGGKESTAALAGSLSRWVNGPIEKAPKKPFRLDIIRGHNANEQRRVE